MMIINPSTIFHGWCWWQSFQYYVSCLHHHRTVTVTRDFLKLYLLVNNVSTSIVGFLGAKIMTTPQTFASATFPLQKLMLSVPQNMATALMHVSIERFPMPYKWGRIFVYTTCSMESCGNCCSLSATAATLYRYMCVWHSGCLYLF